MLVVGEDAKPPDATSSPPTKSNSGSTQFIAHNLGKHNRTLNEMYIGFEWVVDTWFDDVAAIRAFANNEQRGTNYSWAQSWEENVGRLRLRCSLGASSHKNTAKTGQRDTHSVACDCSRQINFRKCQNKNSPNFGRLRVTLVKNDHNHSTEPVVPTRIISKKVNIPADVQAFIARHVKSDTPLSLQAIRIMLKDTYGIELEDRLLYNLVAAARGDMGYGRPEETQTLVEWLATKGSVSVFSDDMLRMTRLVFVSNWSKAVVSTNLCCSILQIDATHKTNRWGFFFIPITAVDPNGKNINVGMLALQQEGEVDYIWALQQFKTMAGLPPDAVKTVYTDGLHAYKKVVATVFPGATHIRCWFHIEQCLKERLRAVLGYRYEDFWNALDKLHYLYDETEFLNGKEHLLNVLIPQWCKDFNRPAAAENIITYLSRGDDEAEDVTARVGLFAVANMWAMCYLKTCFTRGMTTTQRAESSNKVLKDELRTRAYLLAPCKSLIVMEERQRHTMISLVNKQGMEVMGNATRWSERLQFLKVFTRPAVTVLMGQVGLLGKRTYTIKAGTSENQFTVSRQGGTAAFTVHLEPGRMASCDCSIHMQYLLPCVHVMRVMDHTQALRSPETLLAHAAPFWAFAAAIRLAKIDGQPGQDSSDYGGAIIESYYDTPRPEMAQSAADRGREVGTLVTRLSDALLDATLPASEYLAAMKTLRDLMSDLGRARRIRESNDIGELAATKLKTPMPLLRNPQTVHVGRPDEGTRVKHVNALRQGRTPGAKKEKGAKQTCSNCKKPGHTCRSCGDACITCASLQCALKGALCRKQTSRFVRVAAPAPAAASGMLHMGVPPKIPTNRLEFNKTGSLGTVRVVVKPAKQTPPPLSSSDADALDRLLQRVTSAQLTQVLDNLFYPARL